MEEEPTPPAGPEEPPAAPGGSSWGEDGWEKAPALPAEEILPPSERVPLPGAKGTGTRFHIGLELGGFLPFGARDATFATGQIAGLAFGFDVTGTTRTPRLSAAVRLREGTTVSADQESGYDVRSTLILFGGELLLHLFPTRETSDVRLFLGAGGIVESFKGLLRDPLTGRETEETGTDGTLLVDLGFEGILALGGPVDLVFRMEFDVLPLANNVTFFVVAAAGLQLRF